MFRARAVCRNSKNGVVAAPLLAERSASNVCSGLVLQILQRSQFLWRLDCGGHTTTRRKSLVETLVAEGFPARPYVRL